MKPTFIALLFLCLSLGCGESDSQDATQIGNGEAGKSGKMSAFEKEFLQTEMEAKAGNAIAQHNLGVMYGEGGLGNDEEAVKWFRKAADQGLADAQASVGAYYASGSGVERNLAESAKWVHLAAEQRHSEAQFILGMMHSKGEGVEKNLKESVGWLRKSAEQGYAPAQYMLGTNHEIGSGVEKDHVVAFVWYNIGETNGESNSKEAKALITEQMTPDEIAKAEALVKEMIKKNPKLIKE